MIARCPNRVPLVTLFWTLLSVALPATAEPTTLPAYDRLQQDFGRLVVSSGPSGWPMKVLAVSSDPYKFWRGTKILFADWCLAECPDWLADADARFPAHGDLHLGNIGTYPAHRFGQLAFGMVDFDEATFLPFQVELLSGMVTLHLVAQVNGIDLDDQARRSLTARFLDRFVEAVRAPERAFAELESMPTVRRLLERASKRTYEQMLEELIEDGRFRPVLYSGKGVAREILQPIDDRKGQVAALLEQAAWHDPRFAGRVRYRKASQWESAIRSVAMRTRLGSSGSQGLEKILVLVERPFVDRYHDGVFYLKQQVHSAFDRSWDRSAVGLPPLRLSTRVELIGHLCNPAPLFSSYAEQTTSAGYWVTVREPWSDELDHSDIKTLDDLRRVSDILAMVAGSSLGRCGLRHPQMDSPDGRNELITQLLDRAPRFVRWMNEQYEQFRADPRVPEQVRRARKFIDSADR